MDQLVQQVAALLENRYWRVGFIVGVAVVVALLLRVLVVPLLNRMARKTDSRVDDQILAKVNPAIVRTVILEGFHWAAIDFATDGAIDHLVHGAVITILVLMWGQVVLTSGSILFRRASLRSDGRSWIQPQTLPLIQFSFRVLVFSIQAYIIMSAWKFNLTSWLASAGVVGIAVGFAAKDTLANFISGIFILIDSPYQVGQYINIDNQTRGVVTDIGMRSTRILTRDNVEVTVPNAVIGNSMIVNESSGPSPRLRVRVAVSVAYGSEVDQVRKLLLACAHDVPHTCPDVPPAVRFEVLGDFGLNFTVRTWVEEPEFRGQVIDTLNTRIYETLRKEGVEIPFPQQDIHIKTWSGLPATPEN